MSENWIFVINVISLVLVPFLIIFYILLRNKMTKLWHILYLFIFLVVIASFIASFIIIYNNKYFDSIAFQIGNILYSSYYYIFLLSFVLLIALVTLSFKSNYIEEKSVKNIEICVLITCILLYLSSPVFICKSKIISKLMPNSKYNIQLVMINMEKISPLKGILASKTAKSITERMISYYNNQDKLYVEFSPVALELYDIAASYGNYSDEYLNLADLYYNLGQYEDALSVLELIKNNESKSKLKIKKLERKIKSKS